MQPFEEINETIYRSVVSSVELRDGITEEEAVGYFSSSAYRHMSLDEQVNEHETSLPKRLDFMLYGIAKRGNEK